MSGPLSGRRIGLLTASASRLGGGVFEALVAQAEMIRSLGGDARIFALHDRHVEEDRDRFDGAPIVTCPVVGPRQIGLAPRLLPALIDADLDCLHLHGIWMYPSFAGAAWAERTGRPYLVSPHGMLDPWITSRGRWKKAIARLGYERRSWARAHALHALTAREAADIAAESGRGDSVVIPNAGPSPAPAAAPREGHTFVYIGRIHEKKNLPALVEGWSAARRPQGAQLVIAGWGDPQGMAGLEAALAANRACGAEFVGPVYGAEKDRLLHSARCVVLPSHSEGLPMAVLEAWAAGVPVMMTAECNLPAGFAAGAALECGRSAGEIGKQLERAFGLGEADWARMSAAALDLATTTFSMDAVARAWADCYGAAIARQTAGARP